MDLVTAIIVSALRAVFGASLMPHVGAEARAVVRIGVVFILVMATYVVASYDDSATNVSAATTLSTLRLSSM